MQVAEKDSKGQGNHQSLGYIDMSIFEEAHEMRTGVCKGRNTKNIGDL